MSRWSDHTRQALARASELALTSSARIQRSLELLGPLAGVPERAHEERGNTLRKTAPRAGRSAPPPAGP